MRLIQITHHDLDGYGASTVAAACATVERVVHVPRYSDVGPVLEDEIKRLSRAAEGETLLMTDLGLEEQTIAGLKKFAALNKRREEGKKHRLIVLDHHASSLDQMRRLGLEPAPDPARPGLNRVDMEDPGIAILIEEDICATRMTFEHRALFATHEPEADLSSLLAAIDALDLWRKESPAFRGGLALDENLKTRGAEARCGLHVIDLRSGDTVHWLRLEGKVMELYDVVVLPGAVRPMALGFKTEEIQRMLRIDEPAEL